MLARLVRSCYHPRPPPATERCPMHKKHEQVEGTSVQHPNAPSILLKLTVDAIHAGGGRKDVDIPSGGKAEADNKSRPSLKCY